MRGVHNLRVTVANLPQRRIPMIGTVLLVVAVMFVSSMPLSHAGKGGKGKPGGGDPPPPPSLPNGRYEIA